MQVRYQEPVPPMRLQSQIPRDLETICLKCLQKDPGKRYPSALELAEDLQCFLHDEPIRARPVSPWERALKWAKRHPTRATLGAVGVAGTISLIGGMLLYQGQRTRVFQQEALLARQELDDVRRRSEAQDLIRQGQEAVDK
jgi:hypothetical protein